MNILMLVDYLNSGTARLARPIAQWLRFQGHEVRLEEVDRGRGLSKFDTSLAGVDIAHFWGPRARVWWMKELGPVPVPSIVTFHHAIPANERFYYDSLTMPLPTRIHVLDPFAIRQLGRWGITNVSWIRQGLDKSLWHPLPFPTEFTVGCLGGDQDIKRIPMVESICKDMNIPFVNHTTDPWLSDEEIPRLYEKMSVFVCASFDDAGPMPPQEALLCGRPVISTFVGQMPYIIQHGLNGLLFDGSPEGLRECLGFAKGNFAVFQQGAAALTGLVPDAADVAPLYLAMYESAAKVKA
jgi:glycosyltransferase involved in cell wall biosynthesis